MSLIITNKKRGKKPGETDAFFFAEYLEEEPEFFEPVKRVGVSTLLKSGKVEEE